MYIRTCSNFMYVDAIMDNTMCAKNAGIQFIGLKQHWLAVSIWPDIVSEVGVARASFSYLLVASYQRQVKYIPVCSSRGLVWTSNAKSDRHRPLENSPMSLCDETILDHRTCTLQTPLHYMRECPVRYHLRWNSRGDSILRNCEKLTPWKCFGFNFREYVACLILRPPQTTFLWFLFSRMQTNSRNMRNLSTVKISTYTVLSDL